MKTLSVLLRIACRKCADRENKRYCRYCRSYYNREFLRVFIQAFFLIFVGIFVGVVMSWLIMLVILSLNP